MASPKITKLFILLSLLAVSLVPAAYAEAPIITLTNTPATVQLAINGAPCSENDAPDTPARAFQINGKVTLIAGAQHENFRKTGPSLENLSPDCTPILASRKDPSTVAYADEEWIHSTYASNTNVLALLHVEYRGDKHRQESGCTRGTYQQCWWNTVTTATSTNGGLTFTRPENPATRPVIRNNFPYQPMVGHAYGFMNPSNLIEDNGYLYTFIYNRQQTNQKEGNYLVRHADNGNWTDGNWQVWRLTRWQNIGEILATSSTRFSIRPELGKPLALGNTRKTSLSRVFRDSTPLRAYSLVKHTPSGKFVALLTSKKPHERSGDGFYISTADCISCTWSLPRQIVQADYRIDPICSANPKATNIEIYRYASLLDPDSRDPNFNTVGDTPYLYTSRLTYPDCSAKKAKNELIKFRIPLTGFLNEQDKL